MVNTYVHRNADTVCVTPADVTKEEWQFLCKMLGMNSETCEMILIKDCEGFFTIKEKENDSKKMR